MNAYVSADEADAYHNARPSKVQWAAVKAEDKTGFLVLASDYIDTMWLKPEMVRQMRGGGEIPVAVKNAVCELALIKDFARGGARPVQKTLQKGAMSASWSDGNGREFDYVRQLLRPFTRAGLNMVPVERG